MKKSIFLTLLLAAFFVINANPVDVDSAKEIGAKFLKASTKVKAASGLELASTYRIGRGDAAFFVFNADNGFIIVAADDCARPILAYSDEGIFNEENIPAQMQEYLEGFVEQIEYGILNAMPQDEKTGRQWELVRATGRMNDNKNTAAVGPLLDGVSGKWGQGQYYNSLCPQDAAGQGGHALVGCVAVAMGQIMRYHGQPATGNGSHSYIPMNPNNPNVPSEYPVQNVDYGATYYDWGNMPNELTSSSSDAQKNAVATLLWHCGVSVNMMYGATGSGAYSDDVPYALKNYFKYSNDLSEGYRDDYDDLVWLARVKASLNLNRPIHYSGTRLESSGYTSGHAFVCDGYDNNDLLHFNWGWGGNYNAYCAVNALNAGGNKYVYENYAIFNIHPDDGTVTNHTVSVSSNNTALGSAAVSGNGHFDNGENATVTATPDDDNVFCYWTENGGIVSTENPYTFKVLYNRNLVAVFSAPNNITINASANNETGGTVTGSGTYTYGQTVTVSATPNTDYTFCYWLEDNAIVSSEKDYTFTATGDRNLVARFAKTSSVCEIVYTLVDAYLDGWRGNNLNVKYEDTYTESLTLNNVATASFTRKVIDGSNVNLSWTLGFHQEGCQFAIKHGAGDVFYEKMSVSPGFTDEFTMDCASAPAYSFNGTTSNLWSNSSNWTSGNKPTSTSIVGINSDVVVDENATVATLNIYDNHIVTINDGVTLTVTGTIAQLGDAKIIIKEGGQLVNSSYNVAGKIKTSVTAWTTTPSDDGWFAISTPINNVPFNQVTNLTNDTYNVFRYNESTTTWENCQYSGNLFNEFKNGRGYLYRRNASATLEFEGDFNNTYVFYKLSNSAANDNLRGFNLIGNPYPHDIYKGNNAAIMNNYLSDGFYTLQTNGTWLAGTDNNTAIKPCQAILVQAKSTVTNEVLTIANTTLGGSSKDENKAICFNVTNGTYQDVVYAIFKDGEGLNKVEHRNNQAQMLYVRNNGADYAVADIDDETLALDLHFQAKTLGNYTLNVNVDGDISYLHIIDKITGDDIDLLAEGKYSFIGSPNDISDRFVVKLSPNSDDIETEFFAWQNGDDIMVRGEGTLQIFDITGHRISEIRINGVETIRKPYQNGVYIFRLLGNDIKTQKIVIK